MWEDTSTDVSVLTKAQIIGAHQANKTTKETAETVQHIIKTSTFIFEEEMYFEENLQRLWLEIISTFG